VSNLQSQNSELRQETGTILNIVYYNSSSIVIPVNCCPNLPSGIVLNNTYFIEVSEYAPPPATTVNGTVQIQSAGSEVIFEVTSNGSSENASFNWSGTFSETPPYPNNATVLNGGVSFGWFVNDGNLYLRMAGNA
jgi:hypothetical protein